MMDILHCWIDDNNETKWIDCSIIHQGDVSGCEQSLLIVLILTMTDTPNQKKDIGQKKKDIGEWVIGQMVIAEPADSYGLLDNRAVWLKLEFQHWICLNGYWI